MLVPICAQKYLANKVLQACAYTHTGLAQAPARVQIHAPANNLYINLQGYLVAKLRPLGIL